MNYIHKRKSLQQYREPDRWQPLGTVALAAIDSLDKFRGRRSARCAKLHRPAATRMSKRKTGRLTARELRLPDGRESKCGGS